jgi:hypothetical protein
VIWQKASSRIYGQAIYLLQLHVNTFFTVFFITYQLNRNTLFTHQSKIPALGQRLAVDRSQLVLSRERVGERETLMCAIYMPVGWRPRYKETKHPES